MATELKLPTLGENINSGSVVRMLVSEGDVIAEQQPILEIETDKAAIEVPSPRAGRVVKIFVKEGETISVGDPVIGLEDADGQQPAPAAEEPEEQSPPAEEARDEEATDEEAADEEATDEEAADEEGTEEEGAEPARVSKPPKADRTPEEKRRERGGEPAELPSPPDDQGDDGQRTLVPAAPSVRRFAREIGIDITRVEGSGPGGRISTDDVKAHARDAKSAREAAAPTAPSVQLPDFTKWGEIHREPFSGVRRATARQMSTAWSSVPHVTQFDKADVTELEEMRKRYAGKAEKVGGKLTVTAILVKIVASALKVFPKLNASIDMTKDEIVYKHYIHVGVAVDTDRGLLVPVIQDVDTKNVIQLAVELASISEKARSRKLTLEEMQGGSFTISNLGGIGGTGFAPIVNVPEVAILGVARAAVEPVWKDSDFRPRLMLPLSLSYDHRLVDGADGARFLRWVAEALEEPFLMSLEG
jgi:pyruvate dehydrogenase E2 component (dihydrolipoamide acetyltransferase)